MHVTTKKMIIIGNLNSSTVYYVKVRAATKIGFGDYTESRKQMTGSGKRYINYTNNSKTKHTGNLIDLMGS